MSIKKVIFISSIIFLGASVYETTSIFKPATNRNTTMEKTNRNTTFIPHEMDQNITVIDRKSTSSNV